MFVGSAHQCRCSRTGDHLQPVCRRTYCCGIELDRKVLADLAVTDEAAFIVIVNKSKAALESKNKKAA